MTTYQIQLDNDILKIGFGTSAQNDQIVKDATKLLELMIQQGQLQGGKLLKINGSASLPVSCVITHKVAHLYSAIAVYDPKLRQYIICITHHPDYQLGDLID